MLFWVSYAYVFGFVCCCCFFFGGVGWGGGRGVCLHLFNAFEHVSHGKAL